jgi:hypothetical protein
MIITGAQEERRMCATSAQQLCNEYAVWGVKNCALLIQTHFRIAYVLRTKICMST